MIQSFACKETEKVWSGRLSRKLPTDMQARALKKLQAIHAADDAEDLRLPPGNRLHALQGEKAGNWSISINQQWRIVFRFEGGAAHDVQITDYH